MAPLDTDFIFLIGRIRKALRHEVEVRSTALEITAAQFQVLRRLWSGDGITTSMLAQDAGSDNGTMTGMLDRLECRGLIRRERSTEDRRTVVIWLTPAGRELEGPLMDILASSERLALNGLSDAEKAQLLHLLKKVDANFSE